MAVFKNTLKTCSVAAMKLFDFLLAVITCPPRTVVLAIVLTVYATLEMVNE